MARTLIASLAILLTLGQSSGAVQKGTQYQLGMGEVAELARLGKILSDAQSAMFDARAAKSIYSETLFRLRGIEGEIEQSGLQLTTVAPDYCYDDDSDNVKVMPGCEEEVWIISKGTQIVRVK